VKPTYDKKKRCKNPMHETIMTAFYIYPI